MNLADYYNAVIDLSHGIVITLDERGRIVHGNAHFERLSEYQIHELAGRDWFETFVDTGRRTQARNIFAAIIEGKELTEAKGALRAKSGRKIFIDWNIKPLFVSSGEVLSVLCVGVDVTAHVERQQDLRHEHDRLVVLNKELQCLHAMNRLVADSDRSLPEMLHAILALIPPAFQHPAATGVRLVLDGKVLVSGAYTAQAASSLKENVLVHKVKRGQLSISLDGYDQRGAPHAFLSTELDLLGALTKHVGWIIARHEALLSKRQLERQLQHADRLAKIGQFASGVAHELNEPLGNILGFAQLAIKNANLPGQVGRDLENIIKSALHSREIIKKLMLFSRQVPLRKTLVNLNQVIEEALYFTEMSSIKNQVEMDLDLAESLPLLWGDPQHLKQVVVNLVVNAIHAMPDGGRLSLRTASFKNDVYLAIVDTGVGMGPETLRQIFTPFFTTKDVDQGTGLGLSVVHGIVNAHGGVIEVHSVVGQGTRFEIAFPCSETAPGQGEEEWRTGQCGNM